MRILVVDDEPQITRVLRTTLQSNGHEVMVARDRRGTLLRSSSKRNRKLVITDTAMPGMDGIELTRELGSGRRSRSLCSPCATMMRQGGRTR